VNELHILLAGTPALRAALRDTAPARMAALDGVVEARRDGLSTREEKGACQDAVNG